MYDNPAHNRFAREFKIVDMRFEQRRRAKFTAPEYWSQHDPTDVIHHECEYEDLISLTMPVSQYELLVNLFQYYLDRNRNLLVQDAWEKYQLALRLTDK